MTRVKYVLFSMIAHFAFFNIAVIGLPFSEKIYFQSGKTFPIKVISVSEYDAMRSQEPIIHTFKNEYPLPDKTLNAKNDPKRHYFQQKPVNFDSLYTVGQEQLSSGFRSTMQKFRYYQSRLNEPAMTKLDQPVLLKLNNFVPAKSTVRNFAVRSVEPLRSTWSILSETSAKYNQNVNSTNFFQKARKSKLEEIEKVSVSFNNKSSKTNISAISWRDTSIKELGKTLSFFKPRKQTKTDELFAYMESDNISNASFHTSLSSSKIEEKSYQLDLKPIDFKTLNLKKPSLDIKKASYPKSVESPYNDKTKVSSEQLSNNSYVETPTNFSDSINGSSRWGVAIEQAVLSKLVYPHRARVKSLFGKVNLRIVVKTDGTILEVDVVASSGHPILDKAAKSAVLRSKKLPAAPTSYPLKEFIFNLPILFNV